jgi:hypothetical protein
MGNLGSAVDELHAVDVRGAPDGRLQDETVEIRRQIDRLEAAYLARVEVLDRRGEQPVEHVNVQSWLRAACRLSPGQAFRDVRLARNLADVLPLTAAALAAGDISPHHAGLVSSLRRVLTDSALGRVEKHLVAMARERTPHELRKTVHYVKHAYAPEAGARDDQDLHADRSLSMAKTFDGAGVGRWTLPGGMQETVETAIHAASRPIPGDDRTAGQRRADGLATVCEIALASGQLPVTGGVKPQVSVVINAATVAEPLHPRPLPAELFDHLDTVEAELADRAVRLPFGNTISPLWARRWLCDAAVSRIVMDAAGEVLDAGRATRTFTAAQTRAIVARDGQCIWPGCDTPPGWCDAHHIHHWADGGPTSVTNGTLLCGRHHDRVHLHGHAILKTPTGRYTIDPRPGSDPRWTGPPHRAGP